MIMQSVEIGGMLVFFDGLLTLLLLSMLRMERVSSSMKVQSCLVRNHQGNKITIKDIAAIGADWIHILAGE